MGMAVKNNVTVIITVANSLVHKSKKDDSHSFICSRVYYCKIYAKLNHLHTNVTLPRMHIIPSSIKSFMHKSKENDRHIFHVHHDLLSLSLLELCTSTQRSLSLLELCTSTQRSLSLLELCTSTQIWHMYHCIMMYATYLPGYGYGYGYGYEGSYFNYVHMYPRPGGWAPVGAAKRDRHHPGTQTWHMYVTMTCIKPSSIIKQFHAQIHGKA
jgi:hypothetical protein